MGWRHTDEAGRIQEPDDSTDSLPESKRCDHASKRSASGSNPIDEVAAKHAVYDSATQRVKLKRHGNTPICRYVYLHYETAVFIWVSILTIHF